MLPRLHQFFNKDRQRQFNFGEYLLTLGAYCRRNVMFLLN